MQANKAKYNEDDYKKYEENKAAAEEQSNHEKEQAKKDCKSGGHGNWIAGKCNCKNGYSLVGTHCIETAKKEAVDQQQKEQMSAITNQMRANLGSGIAPAEDIATKELRQRASASLEQDTE